MPACVYTMPSRSFLDTREGAVYKGACYSLCMLSVIGIGFVFASAVLIAVADALIKKVAVSGTFSSSVVNPWMAFICILYFIQILLAVYIFQKGDLAVYGNLFIVFYSILMVALGVFFFSEQITAVQLFGIVLALVGAVLLNSRW